MKVILNQDRIVKLSARSGVDVGNPPPGIGIERLRWTGKKLVDIATLSEMYVEKKSGNWELHAIRVPGSQKVQMSWYDRKRLIDDNGTYRVLTQEEWDTRRAYEANEALERTDLKLKLISLAKSMSYDDVENFIENNFSNHTNAQRNLFKNLAYVCLYLAKKEARQAGH